MQTGIVKKQVLNAQDLSEIRELVEVCSRADEFVVKINWGLLNNRDPQLTSDFCFYDNNQLVGYVPLDGFGDKYEVTGVVLPSYRRKGIFKQLYAEARNEAKRRKASSVLIVNYKVSMPGTATIKALGLVYDFSEYHMETQADQIPTLVESQLQLILVGLPEVAELAQLLAHTFESEGDDWRSVERLSAELKRSDKRYFLAKLGDVIVGQIGMTDEGGPAYIQAVGIKAVYRGRGYGRQMLAALLRKLLAEGYTAFELDVVTDNAKALGLYQSCGFKETVVYDYYKEG